MSREFGILILIVSGYLGGLSAGLGFFPLYDQPKNIRLQILYGVIAICLLGLWIFTRL